MILVISWAMMLNIAKLIRDRMIMQNAADNAALSLAVHKARTMNFAGNANYLIGTLLSLGTDPFIVQMSSYDTDKISAYIGGDFTEGIHREEHKDVAKLKTLVDGLQTAQDAALIAHMTYAKALFAENALNGYALKMPSAYADFSLKGAEKYFGLKRNSKGIKYLKTVNTAIMGAHIVYNPYPTFLDSGVTEALRNAFPVLEVLIALEKVSEYMPKKKYEEKPYSWYITDKENFYKQKIRLSMTKVKKLNDGSYKPLFSKLLDIFYPEIMTVYSASAIYNTKGTMFPDKEDTNTGIPESAVQIAYNSLYAFKAAEFLKRLSDLKVPAKFILILAAGISAEAGARYGTAFMNENNPIDAYNKAKDGGWSAHLVPYKTENENGN